MLPVGPLTRYQYQSGFRVSGPGNSELQSESRVTQAGTLKGLSSSRIKAGLLVPSGPESGPPRPRATAFNYIIILSR